MTSLTGGKLPYPLPSEPLALVAGNIKALAQAIDQQKPVTLSYDMTGGNIAAGGNGTFLPATVIAAAAWPRTLWVTVNHTVVSGTAYVDFTLRQGAVELKKARASAGGSMSITAKIDLDAGIAVSLNVQATSTAAAVLITDPRWAHVEILILPRQVIA